MNPKYVTSLELSKKLREADVPQISEYYWSNAGRSSEIIGPIKPEDMPESRINDHFRPDDVLTGKREHFFVYYSAFSIGELGEMLPEQVMARAGDFRKNKEPWYLYCYPSHGYQKNKFKVVYRSGGYVEMGESVADTEAEARGILLLYLRKNNLI